MMVPAPGLFSMTMVAPRSLAISCASVRAMTSVPPPGANGTTILTILSGYKAEAGSAENAASNNAASANRTDMVFVVGSNGMCIRLRLEKALADHAFQQSAMHWKTNRYDGGRASSDGRRHTG